MSPLSLPGHMAFPEAGICVLGAISIANYIINKQIQKIYVIYHCVTHNDIKADTITII